MHAPHQMDPNLARILQTLTGTSAVTGLSKPPPTVSENAAPRDPRASSQTTSQIDPSTITKWPAALRYVTTTIVPNTIAMERLKKMKAHQHEHERLWWQNREVIVKRHQKRVTNSEKMNEVFKSFGQQTVDNNTKSEQETTELQLYDEKVHRKSTEMVHSMVRDMQTIGVPFFFENELAGEEEEQMRLRRKMLEFLDDLLE